LKRSIKKRERGVGDKEMIAEKDEQETSQDGGAKTIQSISGQGLGQPSGVD